MTGIRIFNNDCIATTIEIDIVLIHFDRIMEMDVDNMDRKLHNWSLAQPYNMFTQ